MNFIISAVTDIGISKQTNQDSLSVKTIRTKQGRMVFALMCDGMGGLQKGEVASASLVRAFDGWVQKDLPLLSENPINTQTLKEQWEAIIVSQNRMIMDYGKRQGIQLGTTVLAMLITEQKYYIMNVGDSRAYELADTIRQITVDQTFVEREVALGNMTRDQARMDSRRNVLLQCCGASEKVYPEMAVGDTKTDASYLLCSDGFRHEVSAEEIFGKLGPKELFSQAMMEKNTKELIELNKQRAEKDNISAIVVRTF